MLLIFRSCVTKKWQRVGGVAKVVAMSTVPAIVDVEQFLTWNLYVGGVYTATCKTLCNRLKYYFPFLFSI